MALSCKRRSSDTNFLLPAPKSKSQTHELEFRLRGGQKEVNKTSAYGPSYYCKSKNSLVCCIISAAFFTAFFCQVTSFNSAFNLGSGFERTLSYLVAPSSFLQQVPEKSEGEWANSIRGEESEADSANPEEEGGQDASIGNGGAVEGAVLQGKDVGEAKDVAQQVSGGKGEKGSAGEKISVDRTRKSFRDRFLNQCSKQCTAGGFPFIALMAAMFVYFVVYLNNSTTSATECIEATTSNPRRAIYFSFVLLALLGLLCNAGVTAYQEDTKFCTCAVPRNCKPLSRYIENWDCAKAFFGLFFFGWVGSCFVFLYFLVPDIVVHNDLAEMYGVEPKDGELYDIAIEEMYAAEDEQFGGWRRICTPFVYPSSRRREVDDAIQASFEARMEERGYANLKVSPNY